MMIRENIKWNKSLSLLFLLAALSLEQCKIELFGIACIRAADDPCGLSPPSELPAPVPRVYEGDSFLSF
jgi:hypothetical protein